MTDIVDSPTAQISMPRVSAEDREIARDILESGVLKDALRQVDVEEQEIRRREIEARQWKPE